MARYEHLPIYKQAMDVAVHFEKVNGAVVEGKLGTRTTRLVEEWRALHQRELLDDLKRAQGRQPLNKIEPLE